MLLKKLEESQKNRSVNKIQIAGSLSTLSCNNHVVLVLSPNPNCVGKFWVQGLGKPSLCLQVFLSTFMTAAAAAAQPIVVRDKLVRDLLGTRDNLLAITFDIFVSKKWNCGLADVWVDASRVQYVCCHICSFCLHSTTTTMEETYQSILQQFAAPSQQTLNPKTLQQLVRVDPVQHFVAAPSEISCGSH